MTIFMYPINLFQNSLTMKITLLTIVESSYKLGYRKYGEEIHETMLLMNNGWF